MKLQVSSLNKHMITRTELSILHPLNKHRIHENYEHTSKNKNYLMEWFETSLSKQKAWVSQALITPILFLHDRR